MKKEGKGGKQEKVKPAAAVKVKEAQKAAPKAKEKDSKVPAAAWEQDQKGKGLQEEAARGAKRVLGQKQML